MLSAMLAAVLIAPVAADRKEPPSKIELFAGEGWYKDQKGKEEEFVGVLQFKDRPKDTVGFGRFNPYTLDMSDGKTKKVREVYVGSKPDLLKPYIGKKVKLIGKAVDMEVEGKKHHEIWPARLEVVPEKKEEKKEGAVRATLTLDPDAGGGPRVIRIELKDGDAKALAKAIEAALKDAEKKADDKKAEAGKELKVLAQADWRPAGKDAQQLVIRSAEELAKVTKMDADKATEALAKQLKVEKIDWTKQMVVLVSDGVKKTGGYSIEVLVVSGKDKELTVKWKLNSPKPGDIVTQVLTHPGKAALVERFDANTARFEQAK